MIRNFGPYDILRELGRGAMGMVSLAVHRSLQRECALKTISLKFVDPFAAERFIHEGQAVARLGKHPNIVQVFDAGIIDGTPYIAMEFVEGETLDERVQRTGCLAEPDVIEFGRKLALALDHAHRRGIVHRDVKPANVIINADGEPQLLDFGIAKSLDAVSHQREATTEKVAPPSRRAAADSVEAMMEATYIVADSVASQSGLEDGIQGTPAFMSPEQADSRRGPVDARSDVYALGATLYVLATARPPFEAATLTALLMRVVVDLPEAPSALVPISPDLEAVILKAMEKDPLDRYQTALEFADDLSRVAMELPTRARKLGKLGRVWKHVRRHRWLLGVAGGFLLLAGLLTGYYQFRSQEIQALWDDIAERTARSTAQEVRSLLDPAVPMLQECVALADAELLPVDDQELLARHLVARFRYQKKLSWLSYGDAKGKFTGAWRHPSGRIVIQRSWLDEQGGHVREEFADGDRERLRWSDDWNYDPRERPFYEQAAASSHPVWTNPYEWFGDEGLGITSALALREGENVRGVFTADYHLGTLADFLAELKLGQQGRAYLLGRSGDLFASPERGDREADDLLTAAIHEASTAVPGGIPNLAIDQPRSFSFRHGGRAYVAAIEAFQPAEGLPVVTVVLVPEDDITGPVKAAASRTAQLVGGAAVLALMVTFVAGVIQKRRLVQTLSRRKNRSKQPSEDAALERTSMIARQSP